MAHECFEDEDVAKLMNHNFVSIKVDREERPEIGKHCYDSVRMPSYLTFVEDRVYMTYLQATSGRGGWPATVRNPL